MRLFYAMVLLGSGCAVEGRPSDDSMGVGGGMETGEFDTDTDAIPMKVDVCDGRIWDITPDAKNVDLTIVRTPSGATVLQVPKDGGAVRGFRVDQRGDLIEGLTTLKEDRNYTAVSATVLQDRFVLASRVDEKIAYDLVRDDLGAMHPLGDIVGTLSTETPVLESRDLRIALVGGTNGLAATNFSGTQWKPSDPFTLTPAPIVSLTAAQLGDDTILAWSTAERTCHVQRYATHTESMQPFPCNDARIAMNEATRRGYLVFVDQGTLYRSEIVAGAGSELANRVRITEGASSPRIVFDGERFWISYINFHGEVVVGFIDGDRLASRALPGLRPDPEGYDLSVFAGAPWVVAAGTEGFGALHVCAKPL